MNVELTITDRDGRVICENECYSFNMLRDNPGFSDNERRCFLDLVPHTGAVTFKRGDTTFHVVRV